MKAEPSEPVAVRTVLGWVFCGPTGIGETEPTSVSMNIHVAGNYQLNETLQAFWISESI